MLKENDLEMLGEAIVKRQPGGPEMGVGRKHQRRPRARALETKIDVARLNGNVGTTRHEAYSPIYSP
jgi:hypothetical protein